MAGWLAGLDAFVTGLAYLGALLAARFVLRPLLLATLGSAPFVGGWLTARIDQAFSDFERQINPAAEASLGVLVSALNWLVTQGWSLAGSLGDAAEAAYAALYRLATVTLPAAVSTSEQYVEGLIAAARGEAVLLVQEAEAQLQGELAQVEGTGIALVAEARSEALSEVSAAERVVLQEIRKAEQNTGALFLQAEADIQAASDHYVSIAEQLVAQARAAAAEGIEAVEHDLQRLAQATGVLIEDSTAVIRQDLGQSQAETKQALDAAEQRIQSEIDSVIKSGPWQTLVAAYQGGEAALKADVAVLVAEGMKQIRAEITNVDALRAKYAPVIRAQIQERQAAHAAAPKHL